VAPWALDRYLARQGYDGQLTTEPAAPYAPVNLFHAPLGDWSAHGRFLARAPRDGWQNRLERYWVPLTMALLAARWLQRVDACTVNWAEAKSGSSDMKGEVPCSPS
jgi:hypothetical protein